MFLTSSKKPMDVPCSTHGDGIVQQPMPTHITYAPTHITSPARLAGEPSHRLHVWQVNVQPFAVERSQSLADHHRNAVRLGDGTQHAKQAVAHVLHKCCRRISRRMPLRFFLCVVLCLHVSLALQAAASCPDVLPFRSSYVQTAFNETRMTGLWY